MDFSLASLIPSFIFSVIGIYVFRGAKRDGNMPQIFLGIALMVYSYFVPNAAWSWIAGCALSGAAYYYR